jgi:serine-type D-Ala-D-Ala carboxypeptidase (penicillin-binding protein 5/6)
MDISKRTLTALLLSATAFFSLHSHATAQNSVTAYAVIEANTGHVLDARDQNHKLQIGSLTKIATAMVVLDWAASSKFDLGQLATVPASAAQLGGQNPVGFVPGDRASLRELLYAALMQSDNIAALTLADHVGRALPRAQNVTPEYAFVAQMNALARRLKMERTLFLNPHGLDSIESKLPYSTASDLARLASYAMSRPGFRFYVSQKERQISVQHVDGMQSQYLLQNTNELLGVNAIDGVKTGRTQRAGDCLIISAARPPESVKNGETYTVTPRRLVVVVLDATNRFQLAAGLLERGWQLHDKWVAQGRPVKKDEAL